jgi:hypothetical protein
MSRQQHHIKRDLPADGKRKSRSNNAENPVFREQSPEAGYERNRADNTRIAGLDRNRLNDLYERSSI